MSILCITGPLIMDICIFPFHNVWDNVPVACQPVGVTVVHETWWHMGSLWRQCPLGCVKWLVRSMGAKLVQACPCCLSGVLAWLKETLNCAWSCLGDGSTAELKNTTVWGNEVPLLSSFLCPLLLSEYLYQQSLSKLEKEITSLYLSFLSFRSTSFGGCHI